MSRRTKINRMESVSVKNRKIWGGGRKGGLAYGTEGNLRGVGGQCKKGVGKGSSAVNIKN